MQRSPLVEIKVKVFDDGALSVEGPMSDKLWMIAALENAIDALKGNHKRESQIIIPSKDVSL